MLKAIHFLLTYMCNSECDHCFLYSDPRAKGTFTLKQIRKALDEISKIVRFPKRLIEESLKLAPGDFILGARRPGADLKMNGGDCILCLDD